MIKWQYAQATWVHSKGKFGGVWDNLSSLDEFLKEDFSEQQGMDAMGNYGWELVSVIEFEQNDLWGRIYYFKRPIEA